MVIAAVLIAVCSFCMAIECLRQKAERKNDRKKKMVSLPFYLAGVGMVSSGLLSIPMVLCALDSDWMWAFFGGTVLFCDCIMIAYLNCVIRYDRHGFVVRNFLGVKRKCRFSEVEGIRDGNDRRVYFHGHSILIDEISMGTIEFMVTLMGEYQRVNGKAVPVSTNYRRKWDPMNGHLDNPWIYFFLWIGFGMVSAAIPVMVWYSMTTETDPNEICLNEVMFSSWSIDGQDLMLYAVGDEEPYELGYYKFYGDLLPQPDKLCNGTDYQVGVKEGKHYIYSLSNMEGTVNITLELQKEIYRESQRPAVWLLCILAPFGVIFSYFGIAVGRNPERYSDRFCRIFYKEGFLH